MGTFPLDSAGNVTSAVYVDQLAAIVLVLSIFCRSDAADFQPAKE